MRTFTLYYFLFMSLIVGGFASMAQNDYGLKIIGYSAIGFSILFLVQGFFKITGLGKGKWYIVLEYISLSIIAFIFSMRALFIHFQSIELIFSCACVLLVILYLRKVIISYQSTKKDSKMFGYLIAAYNFSIIFFLISLSLAPFFPQLAELLGVLSFGILTLFVGASIYKNNLLLQGERVSPIKHVLGFKDLSTLMVTVLLIFSLYIGLTKFQLIPKLYSSELPQGYIELIEKAESGQEQQVNGKYQHEVYKKRYESFINKNIEHH